MTVPNDGVGCATEGRYDFRAVADEGAEFRIGLYRLERLRRLVPSYGMGFEMSGKYSATSTKGIGSVS